MTTQTLLASAAFALVTSSIYAFVGYRLTRRDLPDAGSLAARGFVAFWYGLALSTLVGGTGLQALLAALGFLSLSVSLAMTQISLLAICVALWGLLFYLVYLYTGRSGAWLPLGLFYLGFYLFLQYFLWDAGPIGVHAGAWQVAVDYQKSFDSSDLSNVYFLALVVGLLVPQILGALAYLTLYFRVENPTQRYRILLVSLSILLWFGSPLIAVGAHANQSNAYQVVSRFLGLGAAVVIFLAYHPPGWIKRRFNVQALSDEKPVQDDVQQMAPSRPGDGGVSVGGQPAAA